MLKEIARLGLQPVTRLYRRNSIRRESIQTLKEKAPHTRELTLEWVKLSEVALFYTASVALLVLRWTSRNDWWWGATAINDRLWSDKLLSPWATVAKWTDLLIAWVNRQLERSVISTGLSNEFKNELRFKFKTRKFVSFAIFIGVQKLDRRCLDVVKSERVTNTKCLENWLTVYTMS